MLPLRYELILYTLLDELIEILAANEPPYKRLIDLPDSTKFQYFRNTLSIVNGTYIQGTIIEEKSRLY